MSEAEKQVSALTRLGSAARGVESLPCAPDSPGEQNAATTHAAFHLSDDSWRVLDLIPVPGGEEDPIGYWLGHRVHLVRREEAAVVHGWA